MRTLIAAIIIMLITPACFARAYFARKKEMIEKAECIVVVDITSVEDSETKGRFRNYGQKATAKVEQCLKGDVEGTIEIYGKENFICAQCEYKEGRFILFLRKDENLWVGANWELGIRPITGDEVEWYKDDETRMDMKSALLEDVIEEIKTILEEFEDESESRKSDTGQ